jgi:hypothetical protein
MLEVQKYLKNHPYEQLTEELGIKVKDEYDDRVVLNYHQIDSYKHRFNPIVMECRGLILSKPDHEILCRSFDRFWNYGEDPNSDKFDITKAVATDKIDGSLCNVYNDGDKWQVATRQMAFAEGSIPNKKKTYADIFQEAIGDDINKIFEFISNDLTIIFEIVSPETRVVTPYKDKAVYLLDVRNRDTGLYLGNEMTRFWVITKNTKWLYPKKYEFKTWEEVIEASKVLPAMEEGYVTKIDSWRIKLKNPAYLAIAHLRENGAITEKRVVKLIFMQDHEEYLLHFPEDKQEFMPYIIAYTQMLSDIMLKQEEFGKIEDQKEFALAIADCPAKGVLFAMRKGRKLSDILENFTDNYKTNLLKEYIK